MSHTVGILLAGGLSRRYGSPKAFAEVDGELFYKLAYNALDSICNQVVIVSRPELLARFPSEYDVITDLEWVMGQGPLAGILSGMTSRSADKYMVLPCDMPYIRAAQTDRLISMVRESSDITAVHNDNEKIPLFSVWNSRVKDRLEQELADRQHRVMKFMEKVDTVWIESSKIHEDPQAFRNLNEPED